jgi:hypothetical protein
MVRRALTLLLAGTALSACGATQESSIDNFSGEERRVAEVVQSLEGAAGEADGSQICGAVLTTQLADRLKAGSRSCSQELEDALADADDFTLTPTEVVVNGTSATARVQDEQDRPRTIDLVRQGADWRVAAIRPA